MVWVWALVLTLASVLSAAAQQGTINPRIPPPPPPPEQPAEETKPQPRQPEPAPPSLPPTVVIPAGTRIAVVLDTPLSTRISKQGQVVTFRTSDALRVHDLLELPPDTEFTGSVVEVKRPGGFGRSGVLKVKVDRINLPTGGSSPVVARLDSADLRGRGRLSADNNRAVDLASLAIYTLEGTLLGAQIKGGKGAAVGAGAGATIALLIMMARKGSDVYLEPGMPFLVVLDRPVELSGNEVYAAQQSYARAHALDHTSSNTDSGSAQSDPDGTTTDPDRPKLKHRPKNSRPQP